MTQRSLILRVVATDKTFCLAQARGRHIWSGKCLHCNAGLTVALDGTLEGKATLEHIVPRHHGGDDALDNLAIACARCNHQKGRRLDSRHRDDPRLCNVVAALLMRRRARWRTTPPTPLP